MEREERENRSLRVFGDLRHPQIFCHGKMERERRSWNERERENEFNALSLCFPPHPKLCDLYLNGIYKSGDGAREGDRRTTMQDLRGDNSTKWKNCLVKEIPGRKEWHL